METQTSEMEVDMYDVIFKTIYLFLETNEFHSTAASFLSEIKAKYHRAIDTSASNAKTLILRPFFDDVAATKPRDADLDLALHSCTGKNVVITEEAHQKNANKKSKANVSESSLPKNFGVKSSLVINKQVNSTRAECRDCGAIARIHRHLEQYNVSAADESTPSDADILRQSLDILKELQANHVKLIQIATEIASAISKLGNESRDDLFSQYHQEIYELYSYPGTHCSLDIVLVLQDGDRERRQPDQSEFESLEAKFQQDFGGNFGRQVLKFKINEVDDNTDYQVESSVINSSNDSNKFVSPHLDLYIPLESKQVVGDIPKLIAHPQRNGSSDNVSLINVNYNDELTISNMSKVSYMSELSSMSNDDDDRRSPSRFASEFNHKRAPAQLRVPGAGHRVNKSATLPVLNVAGTQTRAHSKSKSRSASHLESDKAPPVNAKASKQKHLPRRYLHSPGPHGCVENKSNLAHKFAEASPVSPLSPRRAQQPASRASGKLRRTPPSGAIGGQSPHRQTQTSAGQNPANIDYAAMIKEKTKLILDRQKSRLDSEHKVRLSAEVAQTRTMHVLTVDVPKANGDGGASSDSFEVDESEFVRKLKQSSPMPLKQDGAHRSVHRATGGETYGELDWCMLKKTLFDGAAEVKMKLLQALRWRLTDCNSEQRERHLLDMIKNDVLSINTIPPHGQQFLEGFYCPSKIATPHPLQEEMARFINTLASLAMGRLYLERDESLLSVMLLPLLMGKLPGIKIQVLTREFTMASVQKLSLSNKMREVAITAGTIEWLLSFVEKNHRLMSTYEAEYSTALLTNLCINKEARNRCERVADRVVSVLDGLIDTPHRCCLPYINPILYSLLLNPVINERAVSRGIGVRLKRLYSVYGSDEELKKQLDAIISMHETHDFCDCDDADTEDLNYQNYADYLEHELSQRDPIYHTPIGEELLSMYAAAPSGGVSPKRSARLYSGGKEANSNHPGSAGSAHIVKKNCVCNSKSVAKLEQRLLANEASQKFASTSRAGAAKPNKWQNRATNRERAADATKTNRNERGKARLGLGNTGGVAKSKQARKQTDLKFGARQRSVSQPPVIKRMAATPKVDSRRPAARNLSPEPAHKMAASWTPYLHTSANTNTHTHTNASTHTHANAKLNSTTNSNVQTSASVGKKHTDYVVNCCYKMDYVNAVAAPPGEFQPQALHASSPNLLRIASDTALDAPERPDAHAQRKSCTCYSDMRNLIGDLHQESKEGHVTNISKVDVDATPTAPAPAPVPAPTSATATPRKLREPRAATKSRLQLSEYHVVSHGVGGRASAILQMYDEPKTSNRR